MIQYILRRLATAIITVLAAMVLLFIIVQLIPGDFATIVLGPRATPAIVAKYKAKMGLDQPIYVQLGNFLFNTLRGDLGRDVLTHVPVSQLVLNVLPHTFVLAFSSLFFASLIGVPLGIYSAAYRNTVFDKITGVLAISLITVPDFLKAIIFLLIFTVFMRWFPAQGAGEAGDLLDQLWHLILPALALGLAWVGYIARLMRASVLEELTEDHVRTARSKGLSERIVVYKHASRAALIPVITYVGMGFGLLLGGAVLIEIVFHRPGLGFLIYNAIQTRNYPIVQGGLIVAVFAYALVQVIADLSHAFVDPRIREGERL